MSNDITGVVVVDDFFPEFDRVRQHALLSEFYDWMGPENELYKRVTMLHVPGMLGKLEELFGEIRIKLSGYRLNYATEPPNQSIHADIGFGTHVAVVFLNEGPSGTAFWQHKETDAIGISVGQLDLYNAIKDDFENPDAWNQRGLVEAKANRAVIYKGNLFHSRFPFEAFGRSPEDGRLIAIAFFTFAEDEE